MTNWTVVKERKIRFGLVRSKFLNFSCSHSNLRDSKISSLKTLNITCFIMIVFSFDKIWKALSRDWSGQRVDEVLC